MSRPRVGCRERPRLHEDARDRAVGVGLVGTPSVVHATQVTCCDAGSACWSLRRSRGAICGRAVPCRVGLTAHQPPAFGRCQALSVAEGVGFEPTEPVKPAQQFSRLPPSSARPSLRMMPAPAGGGKVYPLPARPDQGRSVRRSAKNDAIRSLQACSETPPTSSTRWLRRSSWGMLNRLQAAPALRS